MMDTHPISPHTDQFTLGQFGLSPPWHKLLLRLQPLERQDAPIRVVQFTRRGPKVLAVSKWEGLKATSYEPDTGSP